MKLSPTSLAFIVGGIVIQTALVVGACKADSPPKLPPGMLEQAQYEAHRLFRVGNCEVWGLTYRKENHVVSVCPPTGEDKNENSPPNGVK